MSAIEGSIPSTSTLGSRARRSIAMAMAALTLGSAVLVAAAPAAMAYGSPLGCTGRSEGKPFAAWGDNASYFRLANGGFESLGSWAFLGGATPALGNEPWRVGGSGDAWSLLLIGGAVAESRTLCVSMGEDSIRLFVKNARIPGSILHVEAIVRNPTTGATAQTAFDVNGDAAPYGWAPTMRLAIPNLLGGSPTATQELTLRFTTRGTPATWSIDDVFVDPFKSY